MNLSKLNNEQFHLLFDVRRAVRYHDRRCAFFEFMHRVTSVLTILLAGSVLFDIGKIGVDGTETHTAWWLILLSIFSALLAAMDMVVGYSKHADLHRSLKVRFIDLEKEMISCSDNTSEWNLFLPKRLVIERDEPPIYRALDTLCYNELAASMGLDNNSMKPISFLQQITCQIYTWPDIANQGSSNSI